MSGDSIRGAIIDIQTAARHMTMANGENFDSPDKSHWFGRGIDSLKEGLGILGFDLVKRQTVDDKALEMHFSDGAIPAVTDKPGFDGRDNSSIEDNLWSR